MTSEIEAEIWNWLKDKLEFALLPDNVIALNFRIQKVYDGYELFQEGCDDFYEDHDTWMLSKTFEPHDNFFNLGLPATRISETEVFNLYKKQVLSLILQNEKFQTGNLKFITITYFIGQPELLKNY